MGCDMSKAKDSETLGKTFGNLRALEITTSLKGKRAYRCLCSCGSKFVATGTHLRSGNTTSCGCVGRSKTVERNTKHGLADTPEYTAWLMTLQRCSNPNQRDYKHYGGRGIAVCDRWRVFENFLKDMGRRPEGLTLERVDNSGPYAPGNCVWASRKAQASNTRRSRLLTFKGETMTLTQWAEALGLPPSTVKMRLNKLGYSVEQALTKPIKSGQRP